jgi:hypothetical protein
MVTNRVRSRFRTENRQPFTIATELVSLSGVSPSFVESESMTDRVTSSWPRREIALGAGNFPTKLGFPKASQFDYGAIVVNPLQYSCSTVAENPSSLLLSRNNGSAYIRVNGCVIDALKKNANTFPFPNPADPSMTSMSDLVKEVKSRCMLQAQDPEYSFGEPLGELSSSLVAMRQPLNTLRRTSKRFERQKLALKDVSPPAVSILGASRSSTQSTTLPLLRPYGRYKTLLMQT